MNSAHEHDAEHTSLGTYTLIFVALLVLLAATVAVTWVDVGPFNIVVALAIAITKAALIVWFFMHLNHASGLAKLFACVGFLWLGHMLVFTMADYATRGLYMGVEHPTALSGELDESEVDVPVP
jgi:cytochrome c oxidase subunit IV